MTTAIERRIQGKDFERMGAEEVVRWALGEFGDRVALASSFGAEDVVLVHMMASMRKDARIFTLDTGRLNPETYQVMEDIRGKYGIPIEVMFPQTDAVQKMVREKGLNLFYHSIENRKLCCSLRKVEPLNRALKTVDAWITGLRRAQAVTRGDIRKVGIDLDHGGIAKVNPIADWSEEQTWAYIRKNGVPYNKLHDQGYPSIGCAPCTRAVKAGEDVRAGRWWWENPETKECGLHVHQKS